VLKVFSCSDKGLARKNNQDCVYTSDAPTGDLLNVFIVADGMGGLAAGEMASRTAVNTMLDCIRSSAERNPAVSLKKAVRAANSAVFARSLEDASREGMGTTVVACTFIENVCQIINVGDSRMYVISPRSIRQITVDHSLVEEMIRRGGLTRERARNHPEKNVITRAVGVKPDVEPDIFTQVLESGDTVMLCTDGLTNMVTDERIKQIVDGSSDIATAAEKLVKEANENGGLDNISVVLIRYEED
jgi:protein phosphatase